MRNLSRLQTGLSGLQELPGPGTASPSHLGIDGSRTTKLPQVARTYGSPPELANTHQEQGPAAAGGMTGLPGQTAGPRSFREQPGKADDKSRAESMPTVAPAGNGAVGAAIPSSAFAR